MAGPSPVARSLDYCRRRGLAAGVVERWIGPPVPEGGTAVAKKRKAAGKPFRRRVDLFGCIDIVALDGAIAIGIQTTSGSNHAAHETKIAELLLDPNSGASLWVASPYRTLEVWSWTKRKVKRGGKAIRWVLRRTRIDPGGKKEEVS